ncbi:TIGR03943 family putative permease subunit [Microbacterium sulfonylureivorans]|uniref:TIGR03943 family putative permease subunit n=1 Tax=Microbacterium sulfonylureivorans TaxID=2486854 RepID=UPI001F0C1CF9|nr:TIGR03943 family protein [Microbacterium sulfonylureivorans]
MRSAERVGWISTRWLGVGLAAILAVVTIGLAVTGRLGLYINPDSTWFAVSMAVVALVGAVASFALPLGAEADHGHDHGSEHGAEPADHDLHRHPLGAAATMVGGVTASGVVVLTLVLPPASLSADLAMSRDVGATPLFAGADAVTLAATGDTSTFGVGEWATVFATATNPDAFDGDPIELTGFVTPGEGGDFDLTRLVITHCVIDAQPASIPVSGEPIPETGQWVTVTGTVRASSGGTLEIEAASIEEIPEPQDPYEY